MEKNFGDSLKKYLKRSGLKEKDLAAFINYDITSISKWINGAKLPSSRNGEDIIRKMAKCFADGEGADLSEEEVADSLRSAWEKDLAYQDMNVPGLSGSLAFVDDRRAFFDLMRKIFRQTGVVREKSIEICATFDVLKLLGHRFYELIRELPSLGIHFISLQMCMDMDEAVGDYHFYCETLLNMVAGFERAEITIIQSERDMPRMLMVGDLFYVQILHMSGDEFAACYSAAREITEKFAKICAEILERPDKLLTYASPENLRKTNIQLDSYSSERQRLFFNEAPAMLLPDSVMDELIHGTENRSYQEYLRKLKRVFQKYTCKAHVDLILYSSVISDYIMTGELSLGNVAHQMEPEQVKAHINYLARCLEENENFRLFVLKDTSNMRTNFPKPPSIFIDTNAVTIENSQRKPNENYHISMYPQMIEMFTNYFDDIKQKPNCVELTAEELRRYL